MLEKEKKTKDKTNDKKIITKKEVDPADPNKTLKNCTIATQLVDPLDPSHKYIAEDIQKVIDQNSGQIAHYAWIIHDKDVISEENMQYYKDMSSIVTNNSPRKNYYDGKCVGDIKPAHVHILISWKASKKRKTIQNWFAMEDGKYIKPSILNRENSRIDEYALLYLLHRNAPEKYQYDETDLHCDEETRILLHKALNKINVKQEIKASKDVDQILDEMKKGKTLKEVYEDPDVAFQVYLKNEKLFRDAEAVVRLNDAKLPDYLLNIYIEGPSGSGKTSIAKLLARYLYPGIETPYFSVGAKSVALQNYAGQKVILWNDITPEKMLAIAPTGDIQDMLDPFQQEKTARHIKNSYVILVNSINIFTSTIEHENFFKELITNDTSSIQIYRRIPIIIDVRPNQIFMEINKGEWNGNPKEWDVFEKVSIAHVNVSKIMENVPDYRLFEPQILGTVLKAITYVINSFLERKKAKYHTEESTIFNVISNTKLEKPKDEYIPEYVFEEINSELIESKEKMKFDIDAYWGSLEGMIPKDMN